MSVKKKICPMCKSELLEDAQHFPFCSARCKMIDLGAWASEKYRVKGTAFSEENEEVDAGSNGAEDYEEQ